MYAAEVSAASKAAAGKRAMLSENPIGYFVLSMLAGAYIGFGNILINVIGGQLAGSPATKTVMGVSFGIALSLVVIAGPELFTGNTMVMSLGIMKKTVTLADAAKVWIVCWLGTSRERWSWRFSSTSRSSTARRPPPSSRRLLPAR